MNSTGATGIYSGRWGQIEGRGKGGDSRGPNRVSEDLKGEKGTRGNPKREMFSRRRKGRVRHEGKGGTRRFKDWKTNVKGSRDATRGPTMKGYS